MRPASRDTKLPPPPREDAPLTKWALWCAEIGRLTGAFKVFPCIPGEKRPVHKGWQDEAACDPKSVATMWQNDPEANIGLAIQPGFVVIDADLYKPGAEAALDAFEAKHGELPNTLESRSARGGVHLIYATSKVLGNGKGSLPDFGDVRGHGGFIVGPGSTFEGRRYAVAHLSRPTPLPPNIEGMLTERKATLKDRRADYGEVTEWDVEQAKRLSALVEAGKRIKDYKGPFIEGERDDLTFQLFAEAKNRMIHPDAMLEAVEASGIDGGLEAVERKMQSAYYDGNTSGSYGSKVSAYWLPNFVFKAYVGGKAVDRPPADPVAWKAANPDNLPRVFAGDPQLADNAANDLTTGGTTYSELQSYFDALLSASGNRDRLAKRFGDLADLPQVPWTIPGWLSQNAAWIMYGESGSFKTYITLNMLLCVATGTPFAPHQGFEGYAVGAPRPVILFAGESHSGVVQRVHAAIKGNHFDRKLVEQNLILVRDVYALNRSDGLARMADEIQALGVRPAIIAVDTLNLALDGNEDSSDEIKRALRGLRALATMFDATGLAIDHVGHADKSRPRGSSAKKANSDGMILCERHGDTKSVSLTQYKNRDDDQTKYRAAFAGKLVDLGTCPKTGQPTVNLCFNAIDAAKSGSAKSRFHPTGAENKFIMTTVARAVMARLASNKAKAWSHSALADAVATDATIGISGSTLRQHHLKSLREDSSNPVSRCYDAGTGRWRYWEA